jgi:hypothetical protein
VGFVYQIRRMSPLPTLLTKELSSTYYDVAHPAGYSSAEKLFIAVRRRFPNLRRSQVRDWLSSQDTFTRHVPIRHRFPRERVYVPGIDVQWQADLSDLSALKRYNRQYRFLLCVIDVFSKYAWVTPLKDKTGKTLVRAFEGILKTSKRRPQRLQTDKGTEFLNSKFRAFLKSLDIHLFTTENPETKASVVERFQRTFKSRMWKYFYRNKTLKYADVLSKLVSAYNGSRHKSIGRAPIDVNADNEVAVWQTLYGGERKPVPKHRLKVGDRVRVSKNKKTFEKGYEANWTGEIFTVHSALVRRQRPVYRIKDAEGEVLAGTFYAPELQKVTIVDEDGLWEIEKTLGEKTVRGRLLVRVRWRHYPNKFDSWIPKRDLRAHKVR